MQAAAAIICAMEYVPYKNLPSMAGLCSMQEAMKPGLSVEQCVQRLKRYHYSFKRLHQIFTARLTAEPIYELKMAFSLHAHYCAEHVTTLRRRVGEMREPPLGLDQIPHPELAILFDEVLNAPTTAELLVGLYQVAGPAIKSALQAHQRETNPLVDHPSLRIIRFALVELEEMLTYGEWAVGQLATAQEQEAMTEWVALLHSCLAAAGSLDGTAQTIHRESLKRYSSVPYQYDGTPRRDERFPDPYNMGVNAEVFLYDPTFPAQPKTLMMFYKRLREIDVPEMMASIITETPDKPWDYYRDMTRQMWDEARHAMMGEVGFVNLGLDWRKVMVNFTWSLALNTQLKPIERHAVLYFIEQGLMPKSGKRFEWEVGQASRNALAALFQDYDWADEVLHARVGRDWYVKNFGNPKEAVEYGDECWSRVLMGWETWRKQGLTEHRNWWPDIYSEACEVWGIAPDPAVLNFSTSYQSIRADLKNLSISA